MSIREEISALMKDRGRRLTKYIGANWLPLFSALVLGLGLPLWRYLFVETAVLHVELTGVDMVEPAHTLDPRDLPALEPVRDSFGSDDEAGSSRLMTLEEIQKR